MIKSWWYKRQMRAALFAAFDKAHVTGAQPVDVVVMPGGHIGMQQRFPTMPVAVFNERYPHLKQDMQDIDVTVTLNAPVISLSQLTGVEQFNLSILLDLMREDFAAWLRRRGDNQLRT